MISIILIEPQMGENIGAAARAMKNFGVSDLRIVNPRDGWPNEQARAMSVGAVDLIEAAKIYNDLDEAIADMHKVYATSCQMRDMNKKVIRSFELRQNIIASVEAGAQKIGIVFGRESSGLNNEEITRADMIVSIPTTEFSSLNLGQAICVICYEMLRSDDSVDGVSIKQGEALFLDQDSKTRQDDKKQDNKGQDKIGLASRRDKKYFYEQLFSSLEEKGFFKTQVKRKTMEMKIRNIFERAENLTAVELRTLRGVIASLCSSSK